MVFLALFFMLIIVLLLWIVKLLADYFKAYENLQLNDQHIAQKTKRLKELNSEKLHYELDATLANKLNTLNKNILHLAKDIPPPFSKFKYVISKQQLIFNFHLKLFKAHNTKL